MPSPVGRMMADFSGRFRPGVDVNLGVGYVNEASMPKVALTRALQHVAEHESDYPHCFNYGMPAGEPAFVAALQRFFVRNRIGALGEEQLARLSYLVGASGATSLLEAIGAVMAPGVVLTTDPQYYIYCHLLERMGFEVVPVESDAEGMRTDALASALLQYGSRLRFVYHVTVGNPTGALWSEQRRAEAVELVTRASHRNGQLLALVCDAAYEFLLHDPELKAPASALTFDEAGVVLELGTLSKLLCPGLRVGYAMGSEGPLMQALRSRVNDVGFSGPPLAQAVAARMLDVEADEHMRQVNEGYRYRARLVRDLVDEHLGAHVESVCGGQAGFYLYLTFARLRTDEGSPFFRLMTGGEGSTPDGAPRVLYLPGSLCVHPRSSGAERASRSLRLSYGFASIAELRRALASMGQAVTQASA